MVTLSDAVLAVAALLLLRLVYVLANVGRKLPSRRPSQRPLSTLIVLGSGGHTAEMLNLIGSLDRGHYSPCWYVAAATDTMSLARARTAEEKAYTNESARYCKIFRSREVGQSYLTSVATTVVAFLHAVYIVFHIRPDVVLCNGPGTCLPVCVAGFICKVIGLQWTKLIYVESVARVQKLSLTGRLLYKNKIVDQFFVQWPHLTQKYPGCQYVGRLM
eukprot:SM000307S11683  [mRNA]  locus=s307:94442:95796:+ [translate_table: standard]